MKEERFLRVEKNKGLDTWCLALYRGSLIGGYVRNVLITSNDFSELGGIRNLLTNRQGITFEKYPEHDDPYYLNFKKDDKK